MTDMEKYEYRRERRREKWRAILAWYLLMLARPRLHLFNLIEKIGGARKQIAIKNDMTWWWRLQPGSLLRVIGSVRSQCRRLP